MTSISSSSSLTLSSSPTPLSPSTSSAFASAQLQKLVSPSPQKPTTPNRKILLISQPGENAKKVLQSCEDASVDVDCIILYQYIPTTEEFNQFQQSHVVKNIKCADVEQIRLPPNHMFPKENVIKACSSDRDITGIIICINKLCSKKVIRAAEKIMEISSLHSSHSNKVLLLPSYKEQDLKIEPKDYNYSFVKYNAVSFFLFHVKVFLFILLSSYFYFFFLPTHTTHLFVFFLIFSTILLITSLFKK